MALAFVVSAAAAGSGTGGTPTSEPSRPAAVADAQAPPDRKYLLERVDDAAVVQLYADGFTQLPLDQKTLIWHLYQAALAGRDIYYDQRYAHNLEMRDVLEEIITHPQGIEAATLAEITRYTKLFWVNTGPYNNLTARKFVLKSTPEAFAAAARAAQKAGAKFPLKKGETLDALLKRMQPLFFDPAVDPIVTNKTPGQGKDLLQASANNLYVGATMKDVEGFKERYALNSRLVKKDGKLVEEVYRVGGRYDKEIRGIVGHLEAAIPFATPNMKEAISALVKFYRTGEEADRIAYDVAWVQDKDSPVDTINGFIEVYMDSRGHKGSWEALVYFVTLGGDAKLRVVFTVVERGNYIADVTLAGKTTIAGAQIVEGGQTTSGEFACPHRKLEEWCRATSRTSQSGPPIRRSASVHRGLSTRSLSSREFDPQPFHVDPAAARTRPSAG